MKIIEINSEIHEETTKLGLSEFLSEKPSADFFLLDCEGVSLDELTALIEGVKSRTIGFVRADREQRRLLERFGHFNFSKIWEAPDLLELIDYWKLDVTQTQGFSMTPDEGAVLSDDFPGTVTRRGRYEMEVAGDFPKPVVLLNFVRLVTNWGKPIFVVPFRRFYNAPGKHHLTFDYQVLEGDVKVTYEIFIVDKKGNLLEKESYSSKGGLFEAPEGVEFRGRIVLQGSGRVRLGKVWTYKDKRDLGWYLLGDERRRTSQGEFIHSYFIPGKRSEKLIVGFSGNLSELPQYERQSMANTGFSVLLFCDLRARGGAFQLGRGLNENYEKEVMEIIEKKRLMLGLERQDLIFAGWSMGSFPAMYYGIKMQVAHIIAAKPLLHLGKVTGNPEVIYRTEPSMISAREYLIGRCAPEDTDKLNRYILSALTAADISGISFYTFLMSNDELDRCEDFFREQLSAAKSVEIQHAVGFHADKIGEMSEWINEILDKLSSSS